MSDKPHILGLIPARGGSKRVPGKNIRMLDGKPLIQYTIEAAKMAKSLDRIIISTDHAKTAKLCLGHGVEVPFLRPAEYASDTSTDLDVITHLLNWLLEKGQALPDLIVFLRPTTPFKTSEMIETCIRKLTHHPGYTCLRTVTETHGVNHPYWMFKPDGVLQPFIEGISLEEYYQSQLLPDCVRLNGVIDIFKTEHILRHHELYGHSIGYHIIDEENSFDIDTEYDFALCELIMSRRANRGHGS